MGSAGLAGVSVASAAVVAALAGVVQLGRWRHTGDAPSPWLAAGLFVYSGAALAVPGVALMCAPASASPRSSVALLRPIAVPVVLALFAAAAWSGPRATSGQTARAVVLVGAVSVVATVGVTWSPTVRATLGPSLVTGAGTGTAATAQLAVAAGWFGLAAVFARRTRRAGDVGWWVAVMLAALGASRCSLSLSGGDAGGSAALAASQVFRVAAMVAALTGALRGLQSLVVELRRELAAATEQLAREHSHLEEVRAEDGSRRHQLRSGLAAIGGSAWLLEHHEQALDTRTRAELLVGVTVEVRRMQGLLDPALTKGER